MVLTNVVNSKIHSCGSFPFDFYYNLEKTKEMFPDVKFMSQQTFKEWTKELLIKPDTFHTWLIEDGRGDIPIPVEFTEPMAALPSVQLNKTFLSETCLDQFDLKISNYTEIHSGTKIHFTRVFNESEANEMTNFVAENLKTESPVLLIHNFCLKQLFPLIEEPIPYASHIIKQAAKLRDELHPYYCIHWRMEQGVPEEMPRCAKKLIKTINLLNKTESINKVYLATDYPISGGLPASGSFLNLGQYHRAAIHILNSTIDYNTWVSLNAFKELRNDIKYAKEFSGSGVHGILDKLMCIHSDYFLSGPKNCCRILSTFTRLIVKERKQLLSIGTDLRNDITRW